MKNGVRKTLCLISFAASVFVFTSSPVADAQDSFREFDRKLVATPAELFEALSTFQPPKQRKEIDSQRRKEIEAAGREFLSKLSPAQQEKAWEFAEKYLRKNGVDSSSSQKLMQDFGLPPEMQSELSKQFRKYSNRSSNSNDLPDSDSDDAISQILRKARDNFDRDSRKDGQGSKRADTQDLDRPKTDAADGDQGKGQTPPSTSRQNSKTKDAGDSKTKEGFSGKPDQPSRDFDSNRDASKNPPNADAEGEGDRIASPFELPASRSTNPTEPGIESDKEKKGAGSDGDLDQLLKRLDGLKKNIDASGRDGVDADGQSPSSDDDLDWEKVIENLARKGSAEEQSKRLDRRMLDRAKELISGSFDPEKNSGEGGLKRAAEKIAAAREKVGTRFDRLLVEAAQRTLNSDDKDGVSKSAGSVLGSLIERIQNRASNKDGEGANGQKSAGSERGGNRNDLASDEDSAGSQTDSSNASDSNDRSDRDSDSAMENLFSPPTPNSAESNFDPRKMLDSINDLSAINPTHVFTLFAIIGVVLFVGYLLAKSFVGDEVKTSRRKVIQQIRGTKIKTPKDLVETVDMFLLGKFGIKSNWWNARLAQRVLNSGSPEFQVRVNDLIQGYVRARYMRDDIQIPPAEQQRYKKTLEELSALDIKPDSNLAIVPRSPVPVLPAPAEG